MNVYQELEDQIRSRGVRVTQRLQLLHLLQEADAFDGLSGTLVNHQHVIEQATEQVLELLD